MSKLNPLIYIFILPSLYKQVSVYYLCPPTTFYFYFCIILTKLFQPLMKTSFVQTRGNIEQINCQSLAVRSALPSILSADPDLHKDRRLSLAAVGPSGPYKNCSLTISALTRIIYRLSHLKTAALNYFLAFLLKRVVPGLDSHLTLNGLRDCAVIRIYGHDPV